MSEVVDISPGDLDSSLWVIQPGILHDVFCIKVKQAGWQYTALTYFFPNLNQSIVPCPVLPVASWPAYRFLRRQIGWSGIPISKKFPQFVVIHTVKGFSIVNEAEVDVFLKFSCFFSDLVDVDSLVSGSSAFSKSSLNMWKFSVHILLKPRLENFKHYFASACCCCCC